MLCPLVCSLGRLANCRAVSLELTQQTKYLIPRLIMRLGEGCYLSLVVADEIPIIFRDSSVVVVYFFILLKYCVALRVAVRVILRVA